MNSPVSSKRCCRSSSGDVRVPALPPGWVASPGAIRGCVGVGTTGGDGDREVFFLASSRKARGALQLCGEASP